jgi:hypothetical protein
MPLMHRFRHYARLHRAEAKVARLLSEVPFAPIREVMASRLNAAPIAEARG